MHRLPVSILSLSGRKAGKLEIGWDCIDYTKGKINFVYVPTLLLIGKSHDAINKLIVIT